MEMEPAMQRDHRVELSQITGRVFIGSCANSRIEDLRAVARIAEDKLRLKERNPEMKRPAMLRAFLIHRV
jgi:homoaconitase/3-isopropylmalate dehydratase large subunit